MRKQFPVRVDEDILRAFDRVAWERRLSRTALLVELMRETVGSDVLVKATAETMKIVRRLDQVMTGPAVEETPCPEDLTSGVARHEQVLPAVVDDLKLRLDAERAQCAHTNVKKTSYGVHRCEDCGLVLQR